MSWVTDHQILLAFLLLVALVVGGIAVLAVRAVAVVREAKRSQERVDVPIRAISSGLQRAEERVGALQEHQEDLARTVEEVGARTAELKGLLATAAKALAVLRSPLKYFGR